MSPHCRCVRLCPWPAARRMPGPEPESRPRRVGTGENSSTQLTNMANFDMYSLTISPANTNQWEENLLAQRTLPNGDVVMNLMISKTAKAEA